MGPGRPVRGASCSGGRGPSPSRRPNRSRRGQGLRYREKNQGSLG
jgi:hypothetical protein